MAKAQPQWQGRYECSWGDKLRLTIGYRGMLPVTTRLREVCPEWGVRSRYQNLFALDEPPTERDDLVRAWLLVTAAGGDPGELGLSDRVMPAYYDLTALRKLIGPKKPRRLRAAT